MSSATIYLYDLLPRESKDNYLNSNTIIKFTTYYVVNLTFRLVGQLWPTVLKALYERNIVSGFLHKNRILRWY